MSSGAAPPPIVPIYGAYYFGSLMATAFYSIACVQVFFYFTNYQKDPLRLKFLVGSIWLSNTLHEALTIALSYKQITDGLLNPMAFLIGHPHFFFKYLLTGYISVAVQAFFAFRIYKFTAKNFRFVAPLICFISGTIQIVCTIIYAANGLYIEDGVLHGVPPTKLGHRPFATLTTTILSTAAVGDVLVALSMTYLLVRRRSSSEFSRTAHVLQRLIIFAVNTGIWTALFAIVSLIILHKFPSSAFNTITGTPICSVYTNTLLANLNARASIRQDMSKRSDTDTYPLSGLQWSTTLKSREETVSLSATTQQGTGVWKTTEMVVCSDVDPPTPVKV